MIRKFDLCSSDEKFLVRLPFSYFSNSAYLDFAGYILERQGISNIAVQDLLYSNSFPYLFLVKEKKLWPFSHFLCVTKDELEEIKKVAKIELAVSFGDEFFYETSNLLNPNGSKMSSFRRHVGQFEKKYKFKIFSEYDFRKTEEFAKKWLKQQKEKTLSFDESYNFFLFCLKNYEKYGMKNTFVEVGGKLVGVSIGVEYDKNNWIGLHLKVDYSYRGLSRFLHQKRAEQFSGHTYFTLGHGTGDEGIKKFKEELNPCKKIEHFYVITGSSL